MLRQLSIRDFALIDQLELSFAEGFSVISGETGAGKSILVDALALLAGGRGDSSLVAAGKAQAELSAEFDLTQRPEARQWLADQAMQEAEPSVIVRRIMPAQGASRAWINGRPATISQLAELGEQLIEIHGQHEHQRLERSDTQRHLLDQQLDPKLPAAVSAAHLDHQQARQALAEFERAAGDAALAEVLAFQVRELEDLALREGEYEALEQRQKQLSRAGDIDAAVARAISRLDDQAGQGEDSVRAGLLAAEHALAAVRDLNPALADITAMLAEARVNIDEALAELERHGPNDDADPAEQEQIDRRLARCLELARKHRCLPTELPALTERLRQRLDALANQDAQRRQLEQAVSNAEQSWTTAAAALSKARSKTAEALSQATTARLADLGMDHAQLAIEVSVDAKLQCSPHGQDRIAIQFSANPGQPLKPLSRVASGGELSRVSLALMLVAQRPEQAISRVFDEVDAGIGGETAEVVGRFLHELAKHAQAFCVTHLAQVAARADHQYQVNKTSGGGQTQITVRPLNQSERAQELARMLGNADARTSLAHAKAMLKQKS